MTRMLDLHAIDSLSGVAGAGQGFVTLRATTPDNTVMLIGQLPPDEARDLGLAIIAAADAADDDALLWAAVTEVVGQDPGERLASALLQRIRKARTP
jgi:hypothetical protein